MKIFWSFDNQYYSIQITKISDGKRQTTCDDENVEILNVTQGNWRFCPSTTNESSVQASCAFKLQGSEYEGSQKMLFHFRNKAFLWHQAQGFPSYMRQKAYNTEEKSFKRSVEVVTRSYIPGNANVTSSHVLSKIKIKENNAL